MELFDVAVRLNQSTLDRKATEKFLRKQEEFRLWKEKFFNVYTWLNQIKEKETVYVYGCGHYGKLLRRMLSQCGIRVKGYIISDGQDLKECEESIFYLSEIDRYLNKDRDVIVIGVDIPLQAEICGILSMRGISEWMIPDRNILYASLAFRRK